MARVRMLYVAKDVYEYCERTDFERWNFERGQFGSSLL